jgi:ABC-type sugar transport system ATPase subunit
LRFLAEQKIGIIIVSSELTEILSVCDRIIVFGDGKIRAEFDGLGTTEEELLKAAATDNEEVYFNEKSQ